MISGCGRLTRWALPGVAFRSSRKGWPDLQMHPPAAEPSDAQLRALHVGQDADRAIELLLQLADDGEAGGVVLVAAMREIQPEHVGAGLEQAGDDLGRGTGRAEGGDDFRAPATAQLGTDSHEWDFLLSGDQDSPDIVNIR